MVKNQMILGPSRLKNTDTEVGTNIEYKWITSFAFASSENNEQRKVEILLVPYIVSMDSECCYKYQVIVDIKSVTQTFGEDFFICEECIFEFCEEQGSGKTTHVAKILPAALDNKGTITPFKFLPN